MKIYFISGLGADKRIFQKLVLPTFFEPVYIELLTPHQNESLPNYAGRMALSIDSIQPFYIVGISFGGMLATEIAKLIRPQKTILISSVSTSNQLPWYYHLGVRYPSTDIFQPRFSRHLMHSQIGFSEQTILQQSNC
ncbi:alpha/beta fold hydrolase [Spirosoma endophyticum]|uniref:alpha/beta fold hydrolase n=1 Tax=Spirosoma endophyticum TaxID=662367 RepID=UPI000B820E18|nr:hypothetical protein [Spirosoma endophyticum]